MSNDFDKTLLSRLISDELSEDTAERVKKHLQSCEKSRNELAQLRELSISMQSQEELIPPPSIREAFNRDLEDAIKQSLPSNRGERTDLLSNLIQIFSGNGV
ncbi:MAG: zf-HC2 domain-containing protein, partial [Opitutales bacterium]|nr:zf-HC2 domain-containing protein [Opitutales bacterium]